MAPSQYLLPVSAAAILGGVCTTIGTSTNLVVQGFLVRDGLPQIEFFEIGVAGGFLIFGCGWLYVAVLGPWLLPKTGGMFRLARERGTEFMLQLEVSKDCPLVGRRLEKLRSRLPRAQQQLVEFVEILRQEEDGELRVIFPVELSEVVHAHDRILLSGHVNGVVSSIVAIPGLQLLGEEGAAPFGISIPDQPSGIDHLQHLLPVHQLDDDVNAREPANTPSGLVDDSEENSQDIPKSQSSSSVDLKEEAKAKKVSGVEFFEVTLSRGNHAIGATVGSGEFQRFYQATIVAVRPAHGADHLGKSITGLTLNIGDCLLVLAREQFYDTWAKSTHFFVIANCGITPDDIPDEHFYVNLPHWAPKWCCFPTFKKRSLARGVHTYTSIKDTLFEKHPDRSSESVRSRVQRINIPWYPYISVATFIAMVTVNATGTFEMLPAAFCNACFIIASGILSPEAAIQSIDASVYIMVAASFGIGLAIEVSGLAGNLAALTLTKLTDPISLTIVTSLVTTFATAVVTNNASAAIIYPLAAATARQMGIAVKPLALIVAVASSIDFSTPFGYQCNLMVRGPGGYKCIDYVKFGLFLNLALPILLALNVVAYYSL